MLTESQIAAERLSEAAKVLNDYEKEKTEKDPKVVNKLHLVVLEEAKQFKIRLGEILERETNLTAVTEYSRLPFDDK